ncbi:N-acetylmuramyl-L-alanine amidase [Azospirillum sp. TSH100]|uniref:N-acetylmuramoyl-L-alanine amidase n=1 Tax=Azospirillum sp. TSH100 TaxID=652764 RepID=UPI000D61DFCA|nr:N-acetylmuramoyl-L-alanine amidase [Azospirillum sp. TSH100]PWC90910.1 N-acetylmuramyl-L-alanine amidase [Azospirillum sp. TSH100]QCG90723.1 N-acetylmuramoyl-L-alanine amidase [Azospirillum sp. TSH100]
MTFSIKTHRLHQDGTPVELVATPNMGGTVRPLYLILHFTAGTSGNGAISWLANPDAKASAHLVVDRDGSVTQMVPFNRIAWHAGKSRWNDLEGMNAYSIGIEIVNAGKLKKSESGTWTSWSGQKIEADDVIVATHKHESSPAGWHRYTSEQIAAVVAIGAALNTQYGFLDVLGHDDIAPDRKVDPGPAFPMVSVQSKILGRV